MRTVWANEGRCYICSLFSHWLRPVPRATRLQIRNGQWGVIFLTRPCLITRTCTLSRWGWATDVCDNKQRVLMHGHQGWNVRHGLCHIYMMYVYIWVVYSFCLFCCLFIIVTTQFVALYKPCKPKPKPSTYDPPGQPPPGRDPKTDT